jgi:predicted nucleotide-binding protein (sugar kinase/HSP70/actin superfamily)
MENLIHKNNLSNVAVMPLTSDNGYAGLGTAFQLRAWIGLVIAEVMEEIYGALLVLARDKEAALSSYQQSVQRIEEAVASTSWKGIKLVLAEEAQRLSAIPQKGTLHGAMRVGIIGEIYVRLDSFARHSLVEKLAEKGIITKVAPVTEFVYFCDYLLQKAIHHIKPSKTARISSVIKGYFKHHYEKAIKQILARSGLYEAHMIDIDGMVKGIKHLVPPEFTAGDTVLTVGAALTEIIDEVSGIISIGPFGCMPCRVAEAIIGETINTEKPKITKDKRIVEHVMQKHPALPFLSIESDGNPFPQVIEAKLEIFCMQVARVHQASVEARRENKKNA